MSTDEINRITLFLLFIKAVFLSWGLEHLTGVIRRSSWAFSKMSIYKEGLHFWSPNRHVISKI